MTASFSLKLDRLGTAIAMMRAVNRVMIRVRREMISLWIAPGAVHAIRSALTLPTVAESNGWMPGVACGFRISPRVRTALVVGIHKLGACCAGPDEAVGAVLARAGIDPLMIAYSNRAA